MDAPTPAPSAFSADSADLFQQLDTYPWDDDKEFQYALRAILGSNSSPSQIRDLTIRARCYYFTRKKQINVDFNAYKAWVAARPETLTLSSTPPTEQPEASSSLHASHEQDLPPAAPQDGDKQQQAMYPASFAQIVELITSGKPIPGIKEIPPTILTGQATAAAASKRRKPWEKDNVNPNGGGGTFGDRRDEYIPQEEPEA